MRKTPVFLAMILTWFAATAVRAETQDQDCATRESNKDVKTCQINQAKKLEKDTIALAASVTRYFERGTQDDQKQRFEGLQKRWESFLTESCEKALEETKDRMTYEGQLADCLSRGRRYRMEDIRRLYPKALSTTTPGSPPAQEETP